MKGIQLVKDLMQLHKKQLLLTYFLFSIEMLGLLLRPFILGLAINDLLQKNFNGLILLCVVHLIWLVIGSIRHMYDSRTYSAIYITLVEKMFAKRRNKDVSTLSAHSALAREFVDFLEFDLVYVLEALYNIFGSLILMFFCEKSVVLLCLALLLPVFFLSRLYGVKMARLTKQKNDELEEQVDVIERNDSEEIKKHFKRLRFFQIKMSNQEALNFGLMELMVMIAMAVSLVLTYRTSGSDILAGNVVGIFLYVTNFTKGLETIPYMVQRITTINDVIHRIESNEEQEDA